MDKSTPLRVMLLEPCPVVCAGLAQWLKTSGLSLCGQVATPREATALLGRVRPAVLLMDLLFPAHDGLQLIRELVARHPELRILVFSHHDENVHAERALRAGARGYLMKYAGRTELLRAVRAVARGRIFVSPRLSVILLDRLLQPVAQRMTQDGLASLTDREFHVFQLLGAGLRPREIGERLGVSGKTVQAHRENIKNKLGMATAPELLRYAALWIAQQVTPARVGEVPTRK